MKAGDRFLHDCENGHYSSYVLLESCGFWYLMQECCGSLWCSPQGNTAPIMAFGGKNWHKLFRKLPKLLFDLHAFEEGDSTFEVLYLTTEDGVDLEKELNNTSESKRELLCRSNRRFDFNTLPTID